MWEILFVALFVLISSVFFSWAVNRSIDREKSQQEYDARRDRRSTDIKKGRVIKMSVWIHSDAETGKPDSVDVFEIDGKVNMQWFYDVFESENTIELAEQFFEHLKEVDNYAWFNVKEIQEDALGIIENFVEVVGLVDKLQD